MFKLNNLFLLLEIISLLLLLGPDGSYQGRGGALKPHPTPPASLCMIQSNHLWQGTLYTSLVWLQSWPLGLLRKNSSAGLVVPCSQGESNSLKRPLVVLPSCPLTVWSVISFSGQVPSVLISFSVWLASSSFLLLFIPPAANNKTSNNQALLKSPELVGVKPEEIGPCKQEKQMGQWYLLRAPLSSPKRNEGHSPS